MVFTHSLQHASIESRFFVLGWCANTRSSSLTRLHVSKLKEFLTERPQSSCLWAKPLPQQTEKKLPIVVPQLELLSYREKLVHEQRCMVACIVSISAYFARFLLKVVGPTMYHGVSWGWSHGPRFGAKHDGSGTWQVWHKNNLSRAPRWLLD